MCERINFESFKNIITNKLFTYKSYELPFNCVKKWALTRLKMLSKTMRLQIIYNMFQEDLALNNYNGWYAIKPNQTKLYIFDIYV